MNYCLKSMRGPVLPLSSPSTVSSPVELGQMGDHQIVECEIVADEAVYIKFAGSPERVAFVFSYGACVFWGFEHHSELVLLKRFRPFMRGIFNPATASPDVFKSRKDTLGSTAVEASDEFFYRYEAPPFLPLADISFSHTLGAAAPALPQMENVETEGEVGGGEKMMMPEESLPYDGTDVRSPARPSSAPTSPHVPTSPTLGRAVRPVSPTPSPPPSAAGLGALETRHPTPTRRGIPHAASTVVLPTPAPAPAPTAPGATWATQTGPPTRMGEVQLGAAPGEEELDEEVAGLGEPVESKPVESRLAGKISKGAARRRKAFTLRHAQLSAAQLSKAPLSGSPSFGGGFQRETDEIVLNSPHFHIKLTLSFALAQSTMLDVFEGDVERHIDATKPLPDQLARYGKIELSRKQLQRQMGALFVLRSGINLYSDILDTPDTIWEFPTLEPLYNHSRRYLEIDARIRVMNQRLDLLGQLFDVLQQQLQSGHSAFLEWIVIILIVIEVFIGIISFFIPTALHPGS
ncbi:putative sporulation protein RMD1 [Paratrimastix pyriformis]|uniref:Sporulation protein RMD1 n=1 Tax=Paratrimastix pyriformis TaxID=342808 RepID=A0ABQ8U4V1_9EUKA|nr:putative sporulation protein RMD1 [Paratrimastix pyriformis]